MKVSRALKIRDDAVAGLKECYSAAKHYGLSSNKMEERKRAMLEQKGVNNAPEWVSHYLAGYWRALVDGAYNHDLVHGAYVNGKFYSTHSSRDDYYDKHGIAPSDFARDSNPTKGHYWSDSLKPFFTH